MNSDFHQSADSVNEIKNVSDGLFSEDIKTNCYSMGDFFKNDENNECLPQQKTSEVSADSFYDTVRYLVE